MFKSLYCAVIPCPKYASTYFSNGNTEGVIYLDAIGMLMFVDVFDNEEIVSAVTQHNTTSYQRVS